MNDISEILESWENLSLEDKEYILDILSKEVNERKRERLIQRVHEAERNFKACNVRTGNADELFGEIEDG